LEEIDYSDSAFYIEPRFVGSRASLHSTSHSGQPVERQLHSGVISQFPFWQSKLSWTAVASHSHHYLFLSFSFFPPSRAIASESVAERPDFQGANNKRFFSFFLFQTMSYAQTSGGGNPGTQKWGRGT
jgi:hypothetical protein